MTVPAPVVVQASRHRPRAVRLLSAVALMAVAVGLGSCADPSPTYYQAFGFRCEDHHGTVASIACNKSREPTANVSRYCYKTLADSNCFDRPDPDQKNQPQGSPG